MLPKPKKRLGQNFLVDKRIQSKIVNACRINSSEAVIEIGPGQAALTGLIADRANKVFAIEIDDTLYKKLSVAFADEPKVKIIHADFLDIDLNQFFSNNQKVRVIGNIPYYITTPIIERLIEHSTHISSIWLTVQKEYARRICAKPGSKEYGSLTCFIRYYALPKVEFDIKSGSFFPKPKVDSSLISLSIHDKPPVEVKDKEKFFRLIRCSFAQKRKTLRNNLKTVMPAKTIEGFIAKKSLSPNVRAEELSLQDFADLSNF
ncbi:MAG: 16S rRNA (adenine(1518)-N(6)/adenine(1519)-N(6))-dimethyltransferase RsmA [Candidatus Omnitrophota bacterium]